MRNIAFIETRRRMDDINNREDGLFGACRQIVQDLMGRYGWALLTEAELVGLAMKAIEPETSPGALVKVVKHCYITVWYQACRQGDDPARCNQGYQELHRYLFRAAYNRWHEDAEDITQEALALVCGQIECCQNPGTFLQFALFKLLHARQKVKGHSDKEVPTDTPEPVPDPPQHLPNAECYDILREAIDRLPDNYRKVIRWKYFEEMSDEEIADQLGKTPGNVRVLRHRAIKKLRQDEDLRRCFEGW